MRENDFETADQLMTRKFGSDLPLGAVSTRAYLRADSALQRSLPARAESASSAQILDGAVRVAYFGDFEIAARMTRAATEDRHSPAERAAAHRLLARIELGRGRWGPAAKELAAAEGLKPVGDPALAALCAALPFLEVPREQLEELRRRLEVWVPVVTAASARGSDLQTVLQPHSRHYLLSLIHSRLGANDEALRQVDALEGLPVPEGGAAVVRSLAQTARADVLARRGMGADALRALADVRGEIPASLLGDPLYSEEYARYLRAMVHLERGEEEAALAWLQTSFSGTPLELAYMPVVYLRQAEAHESLGDREEALRSYARFLELWSRPDPHLLPRVEEARARLSALSGEPPRVD